MKSVNKVLFIKLLEAILVEVLIIVLLDQVSSSPEYRNDSTNSDDVVSCFAFLDKCSSPWIQQPLLGNILWHNRRNHNDSTEGIYHLLFCSPASCKHHLSHHLHLYQDLEGDFLYYFHSKHFYFRKHLTWHHKKCSQIKLYENKRETQIYCQQGAFKNFILQ